MRLKVWSWAVVCGDGRCCQLASACSIQMSNVSFTLITTCNLILVNLAEYAGLETQSPTLLEAPSRLSVRCDEHFPQISPIAGVILLCVPTQPPECMSTQAQKTTCYCRANAGLIMARARIPLDLAASQVTPPSSRFGRIYTTTHQAKTLVSSRMVITFYPGVA